MIVADTSALLSLATIGRLDALLTEYSVHTTETVLDELTETSEYDDPHGEAARRVVDDLDRITTHEVTGVIESSRVDSGEGSCARLANEREAEFLLTDDLRALPELQTLTTAEVAISPIVLRALCKRDVLSREEALEDLDRLADHRDWLGAPIYRRARELFE